MQVNHEQVDVNKGLTTDQVRFQKHAGKTNAVKNRVSMGPWSIVKANTFTLFNLINVVLAILVFETGSYRNMLFLVIAIANTIVGTVQELRSKRQIDKLALLSEIKPRVIRNGQTQTINMNDVVQGDLIELRLGDQIPVDGVVIATNDLEVDESQITGESDSVHKKGGDAITSGSYVVSGHATMLAQRVGAASFVNRIAKKAQSGKDRNGEMLNAINKIIRILTLIIIPLGLILFGSKILRGNDLDKSILGTTAAMIGMIPEGLVLLSSVTMAVSAMKLARRRVLVRNLPAIETLARVDTICLDKTGTLTSGKLVVDRLVNLSSLTDPQLKRLLGTTVATIDDDNATAKALKTAYSGTARPNVAVMAFSSDRKWSGTTLDGSNYVVGAPKFIDHHLDPKLQQQIDQFADQGHRVLAFAKSSGQLTNYLQDVQILGLILINDQIRPNAQRTLKYLNQQGVTINVISGDDPRTVSQIAQTVKIAGAEQRIDMSQVDHPNYRELVQKYHVFGRVTPQQKEALIKAYQDNQHIVAMTGDGVNDLLALKQSDCGIAMASGSDSTQSVANFVLIDSDFDAMIPVLREGRRVINNISSVASLYLIKTMYSLLLSILFIFANRDYPFQPIQLTPISTFMIGIPSFILAFEPNYERVLNQFFLKIKRIALPAALCIVSYVLLITLAGHFLQLNFAATSTLGVLATGAICWLALLKVNQPLNRFKLLVTSCTGIGFLILFFILGGAFLLTSIWQFPLWIIAALIIGTAWPFFAGMQILTSMILNRFKM